MTRNTVVRYIKPALKRGNSSQRSVSHKVYRGYAPQTITTGVSLMQSKLRHRLMTPWDPKGLRFYSSRSERRARRVAEKTKEEEGYETRNTEVSKQHEETRYEQEQSRMSNYEYEDVSTESLITHDVAQYITKVYKTLSATFLASAVSVAAVAAIPALAVASPLAGIAALGTVLGLVFMKNASIVTRQNLLLGTGALLGLSVAPMAMISLPTTFMALAGTGAIFSGFTLAALKAKNGTFLKMGGLLMGGLLIVLLAGFGSILLPMFGFANAAVIAALTNVNLYLGLGLFSIFVAFDTQNMIENARHGNHDHVSDALGLFLDAFNIFVRLLSILSPRD